MTYRLFIYEHCPFCVKTRMIIGLKNLPVGLVVLQNDDETTPTLLIGRKQVPILQLGDDVMGESLDIVSRIEAIGTPVLTGPTSPALASWLKEINGTAMRLFLPRVAASPLPEFATTSARLGFIRAKEKSAGCFADLLARTPELIATAHGALERLAPMIQSENAVNGTLSLDDLHLFAQLRSLTIVRNLIFPEAVGAYVRSMSAASRVPLLDGVAA